MTMPDVRDIVVSVEIAPAFIVVKILHLAAHDIQRLLISDAQIPPEQLLSCFQNGSDPCHPRKSVLNNRGRIVSIARWLTCKYLLSGLCCCWCAARQTLIHRRINTSGHNASSSTCVSANSL